MNKTPKAAIEVNISPPPAAQTTDRRYVKPAGFQSRMQAPFSNLKAEAEACLGYAGAERM
jgi:hypothetical protein